MGQEKYGDACPKFAASQKLDPGLGTLLNLADCHEKLGLTASAWAEFVEAATLASRQGQRKRAEVAKERADQLEPLLIKVVLKVPSEVRDLPGLDVKQDGVTLDPATFGIATPIDPGPHLVSVNAEGRKEWAKAFDAVGEGKVFTIEVPVLEEDETVEAVPPVTTPPEEQGGTKPGEPVPPDPAEAESDGTGQRIAGIVIGVIGLGAIGGGAFLGLGAQDKWDKADCPQNECSTKSDQDKATDARTEANWATVAFFAGGVFTLAGVLLYATAPDGKTSERPPGTADLGKGRTLSLQPAVGPQGGGMWLGGRF